MSVAAAAPVTSSGAQALKEDWMEEDDLKLMGELLAEGQAHLFWGQGVEEAGRRRLLGQLRHLDRSYTGGLPRYIRNARQLLKESKEGLNPYEGCVPSVPEGEKLDFGSPRFREFERKGVEAAGETAFVLVAGGLGERLGYSGIKVALPMDLASGACFLQRYVESILALQRAAQAAHPGRRLPLAIMTSDDTHARTLELLESHAYFGAHRDQIHLLKQEKVACLADNDARLALDPKDPGAVQTKPHGHGDVHMLLHSSGLAEAWAAEGLQWVAFFQDTNGLVFRALPAALGVSAANSYDVNSLAVPRKAKEAIGAITKLARADGSSMTINVEYNQLDPLLRATTSPEGDVNDASGYSPLPGNINQLVLRLGPYLEELHRHGGVISEFVNPKYADEAKSAFKSSTRLECMMQDFPKLLPSSARVGFTVINQVWAAYSPVKNSPGDARAKAASGNPSHSATAAELDIYKTNCMMLRMLGAAVADPTPVEFNGIAGLELWPRVSLSPLFAATFDELEAKVSCSEVHIGADTALVVEAGDASIQGLDLQRGALEVRAPLGARVKIHRLGVNNEGWAWEPVSQDQGCSEEEYIRGFRVKRTASVAVEAESPGDYEVSDPPSPPGEGSGSSLTPILRGEGAP